ncbi:MAG: hypothetical protein NTX81_04245 [Candidatus Bathyarchaeota archaeon]|jgi:hypothetical protein|nr:hypothetical protein [Candidatus Bathyarchaeota archaeon]
MDEKKIEPPEKKQPEATRLVIFLPGIDRSTEKTLRVAAVTDEGKVDTTRDDIVELSIGQDCRLRFKDSSKKVELKLLNGEANANLLSNQLPEASIFKARWISGRTPLQPTQVTYLGISH